MNVEKQPVSAFGVKFFLTEDGERVGRAYLYVLTNDLHHQPFGLLEDLYVEEEFRNQGYGEQLVRAVIQEAKERGCYKLICTSRQGREELHQWYIKLGFTDHGREFRMDFKS